MEPRSGFRITGQLVLGVSIAVIGALFTLDNLHILRAREYLQFWPLALIAIGVVHVSQARTGAGRVGGGIWILVGVVLLGNRLGLLSRAHLELLAADSGAGRRPYHLADVGQRPDRRRRRHAAQRRRRSP